MNQSKNKLIIIVVAIVIALGLGTWATVSYQNNDSQPQVTNDQPPVAKTGRSEITYQAEPGITSLEQLKKEATDVVVAESEYGELVDSIEGHKGGTDGKYWSFYVNGEMAQVGAGAYLQEEGDVIEWKFQKL